MEIICAAAQKGGVGKTTTATALAEAAAYKGKRALAIDLDAGNLSFALAADRATGTTYDLLKGTPAADLIQHTGIDGLDVIPAGLDNTTIKGTRGSANRLKDALQPIKRKYDYVFVDTPAGAGELQYNGLAAADLLIIPVLCEVFSVQTLYQFAGIIQELQQINTKLKAAAIVANFDRRTTIAKQMRESISDALQELNIINAGAVRTCSKTGEAIALQRSLYEYAPSCKSAADYLNVFSIVEQITK